MTQFSGLVITLNEQDHIAECVRSLFAVCDDVVVVDSESQDRTAEIAVAEGATLIRQPFLGDGPQRSAGLPHCRHDWILYIDADERLDSDLVAELKAAQFDDSGTAAYECRRKNHMGGRWIKVAAQYPDWVCRVFDKSRTDFSPLPTHARITEPNPGKLAGHILHYSFRDLHDMLDRMNRYSDWQSTTMFEEGRHVSPFKPPLHGFMAFLKFYIVRRGFMAGLDGLTLSIFNAMGSYLKYAKLIEKVDALASDNTTGRTTDADKQD